MKAAVIISKTLNCALLVLTNDFLIESIRGSAEFLSDHFEHYARRFRAASQLSILAEEQSGLPTHIAATESVSLCAPMKSWPRLWHWNRQLGRAHFPTELII